ncbi:oxidoreductase [Actinosynnema sp. ALI-1.44]|uniref:oxidoreductase n=1 Tax=Actinosynnema sp. ALI-1.44 TaxID=1933779 RepID=UPI0011785446|nr:oxidoreductase [Actinosynnema sp. ALI-1.44]
MGIFDKLRRKPKAGVTRTATSKDIDHLAAWAQSRRGVEAYVEPRTNVTHTTVVLIASDGEWTRRRIDDEAAARSFGKKHSIPVYDAGIVGYPQRMRDYTRRKAEEEKRRNS